MRVRPSLFLVLALGFGALLPDPDVSRVPFHWGSRAASALQDPESPAATVLGRIVDAETGAPQVGAFVALLDPAGERRGAVLTDEAGRYVVRAADAGRYRVRVEGLGLRSTFGPFFDLAAGEVREEDVSVEAAALNIEGLRVTGESQCDLGRGDGTATVRLWDEARKALEVAEWIDEVGYIYDVTNVRRLLGPDAREVIQEERSEQTLVGRSPFRSIDAETLMGDGFVIQDSLGISYYGPDAAVLLSDLFLSAHCFEAVRDDGRLGLAFRPRDGRTVPDIEGTLWFLDEGVLDRLEYRYTGVDDYEDASALGGEVEFRRLPQGAWIVQEWRIRMPTRVVPIAGSDRARLVRIRETGAVVREARSVPRVNAVVGSGRGALRGRLTGPGDPGPDSARLYLSGTSYGTAPGPDGSFLLERVLPGRYDLVVDHPGLAAMGEPPRTREVEVVADSIVAVEILLPTREEVLSDRCRGIGSPPGAGPGPGARRPPVVGGVVRTTDGRPGAGLWVRVWWEGPAASGARAGEAGGRPPDSRDFSGALEGWSGVLVRTDARGGWAVCGVPEARDIRVDAPEARFTEAELEAGAGLGTSTVLEPLEAGSRAWVELEAVPEPGVPPDGGGR